MINLAVLLEDSAREAPGRTAIIFNDMKLPYAAVNAAANQIANGLIGLAGEAQRRLVVDGLSARFAEAATEKNGTLVRYDILQGLQNLYHATGDETIHELATQLVATEEEIKYRKKYAGVLKGFRF